MLIACGNKFFVFIDQEGYVNIYSEDKYKNIGIPNTEIKNIKVLKDINNAISVWCGFYENIFIATENSLYIITDNGINIIDIINIKDISSGIEHTYILTENGKIYRIPNNKLVNISDLFEYSYLKNFNVRKIGQTLYNDNNEFFICDFDTILCRGTNKYGQLGVGDYYNKPFPIGNKNIDNIKSVHITNNTSYFLKDNGDLYYSGDPNGLSNKFREKLICDPILVDDLPKINKFFAGYNSCLFTNNEYELYGFGNKGSLIGEHFSTNGCIKIETELPVKDFVNSICFSLFIDIDDNLYIIGKHKLSNNPKPFFVSKVSSDKVIIKKNAHKY